MRMMSTLENYLYFTVPFNFCWFRVAGLLPKSMVHRTNNAIMAMDFRIGTNRRYWALIIEATLECVVSGTIQTTRPAARSNG